MLVIQRHKVKIYKNNIEWFQNLGYECKLKEIIEVQSNELKYGSNEEITFVCDYCLGKNIPEVKLKYNLYQRRTKEGKKDACGKCKNIKQKETVIQRYGVENVNQIPSVTEKVFKNQRKSIEEVREIFAAKGYVLLETEYRNTDQKLRFLCPFHGERYMSLCSIYYNNNQCRACFFDSRRGEKHFNWKGGVSSESEKIRQTPEYFQWRNAVYTRDNFTCQCCDDGSGNNLNAHHILNFSKNPELRFEISNGITLCKDCHDPSIIGSFHNTYGTWNNTREQLFDFFIKKKSKNLHKIVAPQNFL